LADTQQELSLLVKKRQLLIDSSEKPQVTGTKSEEVSRELLGLANQIMKNPLVDDPNESIINKAIMFANYASTDQEMIHSTKMKYSDVPLVPLTSHSFSKPVKDLESLFKYWREAPEEKSEFPKDYNWVCDQIADEKMEFSEEQMKEFLEDPYIDEEEQKLREEEILALRSEEIGILQEKEVDEPTMLSMNAILAIMDPDVSRKKRKLD